MKRQVPGETGLSRIVKILESFNQGQSIMTRAEVVRRTGLPAASTYRLINEMLREGFLDPADGGIQTGVRLWELASRESRTLKLRSTALPFMEDLQEAIQQHTQLSILEGTDILYIERLSAPTAVTNIARVAGRMPASITAAGLVLTAFASLQTQEAVLSSPLPSFTSKTPRTTAGFDRVLADVRLKGYARTDGWIDEGVTGLGLPIRDSTKAVIAALSLLLPNDASTAMAALPAAQIVAASISRALGWDPKGIR
ncbi:IclR family transcriptional regulator [Rhodococcus sp. NPDC056960]|uniref:IclR family transcriptional regulator n=1 Tax=Rhodococcus opacus TaxID=37919 RepID=A0A076EKD2_RHOOP|nr:IclR family transcriptional regulator [Rhodococcus opacus]AII05728.1 hypothetical protein EP51_14400 [Rhodococcus opacus]